ncbi:hypothetical protein G6M17_07585 [Agrobacterium tumefaciens]|uniref:hypothetical protein n=1 Tax=Rhizobium/Agrobacterium group TaxID=227290 RepID=UPI0007DF30BA|nr:MULTISPECIES: hypothetical protein [Rhizobium/Agrobacterium group]AQS61747.1 hypothetical protein B0909_05415 [Rhizobium rhizogenes]MCZ7443025.1 hypothetical protein [Rhizobium rhizogenes]NSZ79010.1 hypothetical protein [Agrobacterium tumefaciens]OAM65807.1 hypothetical protein A8L48_22710 [Rhizobium rhizogenes]
MAEIECVYRARVFYEASPDIVDAIENKAFGWQGSLEVETMCGNACCPPHIVAEGRSLAEVTKWAEKVERYITRRKGAELLAPAQSS